MRFAILILAAVMFSSAAHAADEELRALREEVAAMREALRDLDRRIESLESARAAAGTVPDSANAAPAPPPAPQASATSARPDSVAALRINWSHVAPGTTKEKALEALGPASQEMTINGKLVWYYVYPGIGRGSIFFNDDGRVSSRQAPSTGW